MFKFLKDIGIVYGKKSDWDSRTSYWDEITGVVSEPNFYSFKRKDISDEVDNKIKVFGHWFDKKNVIFCGDIYDKQREAIKKRHQNDK